MQNMWAKIGETAGKVYHLLEDGEKNITRLKKSLKGEVYGDVIVDMAIGWLAREGKIDVIKDGRSWIIRLKEE